MILKTNKKHIKNQTHRIEILQMLKIHRPVEFMYLFLLYPF